MAEIINVDISMFEDIYKNLLRALNKRLTKNRWMNIFSYPWNVNNKQLGFALKDGEKIVGFLGTIMSRRNFDGKEYNICNLTSWIVNKKYRSESIKLLLAVLQDNYQIITNLTASKEVTEISKYLGFKIFDEYEYLLFPKIFNIKKNENFITNDLALMNKIFNKRDIEILNHHKQFNCQHMMIYNNLNEYCYIIFHTHKKFRFLKFTSIDYISNEKIFMDNINKILWQIIKRTFIPFIKIDSRLLKNMPACFFIKRKMGNVRLYKSVENAPEINDNLYSEMILLNL